MRENHPPRAVFHPKGFKVLPYEGLVLAGNGRPYTKINTGGYVQRSRPPYLLMHRVVWEAVHGPIPEGMEINHKNGIKTDNRISNLELVTPSENRLHAFATGLARANGSNNGRFIHGRYVGKASLRGKRAPHGHMPPKNQRPDPGATAEGGEP